MSNKGILIKTYEQYEFMLLKDRSGRGKNLLYYYVFNPAIGKKERKRISVGLTGDMPDRTLMRNASDLADALIINLKKSNYNPVTGTFSDSDVLSPSNNITECCDAYIAYRKKKYAAGAIGRSRMQSSKTIEKHFKAWLAAEKFQYRKPGSFTEIDIENFFNDKSKELKWSKETWNNYRDNLKSIFVYLIKLKVITDNPVSGIEVKNTKNDSSIYKIYEEDELTEVLKLLKADKRYYLLLIAAKLLYKYSIRLEEQLELQIQDYDPKKMLLTIPPEKTKNGSEAIFQIDEEMHNLLMSLIREHPENYYIFGVNTNPRATRLTYGYFGNCWRKFRAQYKLNPKLKLYALKHSAAYYSLEDGISIPQLSKRLRHDEEKTTRRYIKNSLKKYIITSTKDCRF